MIDLVIVGGGPAGLAAAYSAWQHGLRDILILEPLAGMVYRLALTGLRLATL